METAKEILYKKAQEFGDNLLQEQVQWIVEAMEDYAYKRLHDQKCTCNPEDKTGTTTFACCNLCGRIDEEN